MCFFLVFLAVICCDSSHFACSEEARAKSPGPGASQVALASLWNPAVDFPTTRNAPLRPGQTPFEGHKIFVQNQSSTDEFIQRPLALCLLQKAEQSPCRTVRGLQDPMGPLHRYLLHPRQEEGAGAISGGLARQRKASGAWPKRADPQCFSPTTRCCSAATGQPETTESAWTREEGQGEGSVCVAFPTHWRSTASMAWTRHGIHPGEWLPSDLSVCASSSSTTSYFSATAISRGAQPVGRCSQEALSRSQQNSSRDQRGLGEVRSYEHPASGSSTSQSHQPGEAIQRQDEGVTGVPSAAQGLLAEAPQRSDCMLGRASSGLYRSAESLQGDDGQAQSQSSNCPEGHSKIEPHGRGLFISSPACDCRPDRARRDRDRRFRELGPDGAVDIRAEQMHSDVHREREWSDHCVRRRGHGTASEQTTSFGRARWSCSWCASTFS